MLKRGERAPGSPLPERSFRSPRLLLGFLACVTLGLAAITTYFWRTGGVSFYSASAAAVTLLSVLGFADAFTTRVSLYPDSIVVRSNLRTRTYRREALEAVTWAKGAGVSMKLHGGKWVPLPDVGNAQSVTNSIRAWLRRR